MSVLLSRFLILLRSSDAAFLVNVMATTSLGNSPFHSTRLLLSLAGARSAPWPCNGTRGPFGSKRFAL